MNMEPGLVPPRGTEARAQCEGQRRAASAGGKALVASVVLAYAASAILVVNTGIADNADFSRSMQWFIEKPAAMATNWPADDATWALRFKNYRSGSRGIR
jgi:hypothetical protein